MKKILSICLAVVLGLGVAMAQSKPAPQKQTTVFKADVTCQECAKKIMDNVAALGKGIDDVQVSVETQTVAVTYDAQKNSDENIAKGLASIGVKAAPAQVSGKPYCKIPPVNRDATKSATKMEATKLSACKKADAKAMKAECKGDCDHKAEAKACGQGKECDHKAEVKACGQGKECDHKAGGCDKAKADCKGDCDHKAQAMKAECKGDCDHKAQTKKAECKGDCDHKAQTKKEDCCQKPGK